MELIPEWNRFLDSKFWSGHLKWGSRSRPCLPTKNCCLRT